MNTSKRSHGVSKSSVRHNGKKESSSNSKQKTVETKPIEPDIANIPIVKQCDNVKIIPKFAQIASKSGEDGVSMDDLDALQQDLEKLLSTSAVRIRYLLGEIGEIDKNEDGHERKSHDKTSAKRRRVDDKPKFKDVKNGVKVNKKHSIPVNKFINKFHQEIPKVTLPRNDACERFWMHIEPFCAKVTQDDVACLDSLIQEFSIDVEQKIPELGEHFATTWSEQVINEEQNMGKGSNKKNVDLKKTGLQAMVDTFSMPQTQRLLSALLEEKVTTKLPKLENGNQSKKQKSSEMMKMKATLGGQKVGSCLDRRLKKELLEQGILTIEDMAKHTPDDEILTEIKKCQQELTTVNEYNLEELNKLKALVVGDVQQNLIKDQLDKVEKDILQLYNKIVCARKTAQQEGTPFSEQIIKELESQSDVLLKQQVKLNWELKERKMVHQHSIFSEHSVREFESHSEALLRQMDLR